MADNYLITGYWGEPHVTAENDRGINAAMFGTGRFVLPVGEQFKAEYIGNNTIRMYDGKLMDNGAAAGIPVGEYVDLLISNAGQGMKRNDLIVFQYAQDASTLIESGTFVVIQGEETTGTATDPALTQEDLLSGTATFDQFALWRVSVSGATISAPVQVFDVYQGNSDTTESEDHPGCYYREVDGVVEWVNPPAEVGVEYRTSERYNGKAVYSKVVDFGKLPHTTSKTVAHGITGATMFVSIRAVAFNNGIYMGYVSGQSDSVGVYGADIKITTAWNASGYTAHVFLKYTKD